MLVRVHTRFALLATTLLCAASAPAQDTQPSKTRTAASRPATARPPTSRPAASRPAASRPATSQPALNKAIAFHATSLADEKIDFPAAYKGKLVLLTFWATWCPHCRAETKYWRAVYDKFHDDGLVMIGLPTDSGRGTAREKVEEFVKKNGLVWQQIFDEAPRIAQSYGASAVPCSFLIDGDTGRIVAQRTELRKEALTRTIEEQLAVKQGRPLPAATSQPSSTQPAVTPAPAAREE